MQNDIIDPVTVESDYKIKVSTQRVWKCQNRYGWRELCIKSGSKVVYKRADIENWLEARKGIEVGNGDMHRTGCYLDAKGGRP